MHILANKILHLVISKSPVIEGACYISTYLHHQSSFNNKKYVLFHFVHRSESLLVRTQVYSKTKQVYLGQELSLLNSWKVCFVSIPFSPLGAQWRQRASQGGSWALQTQECSAGRSHPLHTATKNKIKRQQRILGLTPSQNEGSPSLET